MSADPANAAGVIIADDHAFVRHGIRLLVSSMAGLTVLGEAADGEALVQAVDRTPPALVLTDISMPGVDGFTAIATIRQRHPGVKVLVMSMHDASEFVRRAIRAGADGYVLKNASAVELEHAIFTLLRGGRFFSSEVSLRLAQTTEPDPRTLLTPRQLEVLCRLVAGSGSKEIAFELGLSPRTVDVHRAAIMTRLGLGDLASLTLHAVRWGLIDPRHLAGSPHRSSPGPG